METLITYHIALEYSPLSYSAERLPVSSGEEYPSIYYLFATTCRRAYAENVRMQARRSRSGTG